MKSPSCLLGENKTLTSLHLIDLWSSVHDPAVHVQFWCALGSAGLWPATRAGRPRSQGKPYCRVLSLWIKTTAATGLTPAIPVLQAMASRRRC